MRTERLRYRLLLSFGGLILLVVLVTLVVVRATTVRELQRELRANLGRAGAQFDRVQAERARRLALVTDLFNQDGQFLQYYRETIDKREAGNREEYEAYRASLQSDVYDNYVLRLEQEGQPLDLFVIADLEGRVVTEFRRGQDPLAVVTGKVPPTPAVLDVLQKGNKGESYIFYPNPAGRLYLCSASPLLRGDYVDGVLLVGVEMGGRVAGETAATMEGVSVFFASPARLLASSGVSSSLSGDLQASLRTWRPPPEAAGHAGHLGSALAGRPSVDEASSLQEMRLAGTSYLVLPHPLLDAYSKDPAAWVFFLKDLRAIDEKAIHQSLVLMALGAGALLLALLVSFRIAGRITRPIEGLAARMQLVGQGDLEQQAEVVGRDEVARLAASFNEMTIGLRQKRVLEKYVPQGARQQIEQDASGQVRLGGQRVRRAILFSDLRGFTSLSESLEPDQVVNMLNEYLQYMTRVIEEECSGDINEYIGDAILAVFKDQDGVSASALAVSAALRMHHQLEKLRAESANPVLQTLRMGIGIHTGVLVEGTIGSGIRAKYSVVGDTVNLAARIQDRSRDYTRTGILISGDTRADLGEEFLVDFLGDFQFKGKSQPVPVYEVLERKGQSRVARAADAGPLAVEP
ncbi:MAG TPA: adenylate/guanylate cyclase domain-containing protein [Candidatus Nitrosotenuis sp.]|jgi:class 3 adenylate cyclase|nr:adenylate/guanylate cyclase domain-containing protein [Candidatus Nitrosotenuis sp.]